MKGTMRPIMASIAIALIAACSDGTAPSGGGGSGGGGGGATPYDFTGTWMIGGAHAAGSGLPAGTPITPMPLTVTQTGDQVTGTVPDNGNGAINVRGTASPTDLSWTATQGAPCNLTIRGRGTLNTDQTQFSGQYTADGACGHIVVDYVAIKQ